MVATCTRSHTAQQTHLLHRHGWRRFPSAFRPQKCTPEPRQGVRRPSSAPASKASDLDRGRGGVTSARRGFFSWFFGLFAYCLSTSVLHQTQHRLTPLPAGLSTGLGTEGVDIGEIEIEDGSRRERGREGVALPAAVPGPVPEASTKTRRMAGSVRWRRGATRNW